MTPAERGRFCSACSKTVVDFSRMSDLQLARYFSQKKGDLCGRFHREQLYREIVLPQMPAPWMRPIVPLALSALAILFEACAPENVVTGEPMRKEILPIVEASAAPEKNVIAISALIPFADTILPETKAIDVQVVTKKNKTLPPSFLPVDTMRLPQTDTIQKREQTMDTLRKPLLHPRKEALIMGMVLYTQKKAVAEKNKNEEQAKEGQ